MEFIIRERRSWGLPWGTKIYNAMPRVVVGLGLLLAPLVFAAGDAVINAIGSFSPAVGGLNFISPAMGQKGLLANKQSDALDAYRSALNTFELILRQRRVQINSSRQLPNLPGQALYLARNDTISAYKDLTDALPSKIGKPNKFGIPPAYFDADNEQLLDEYRKLFDVMDAPPANAQKSDTPFKDVADLGIAIARAKGLDAANAEAAGRISLGIFFAETNGISERRERAFEQVQGKFANRPIRRSNRPKKVVRDKEVDRVLRSCAEPSRREGRGADRQSGSSA